ncbi:histone-lysine N-methyltransferase SETMAR [Plakobranchus ocellatus]|uniref:Histone-lysine N-methyltransferase SETMAR n=1 Tax=Plakobranchus ocellatus TaxID=259542 RepID=A0AAV3XUX3_9GAST|nr:histone-lysine N-methyltransferase SETMAR [Plakobranchus ocellatus]
MIRANRRVKQKKIADEVGISKERVHHIVTTVLGYRKVSAHWVPRQLTVEMKAQRKDMCTQLLGQPTPAVGPGWQRASDGSTPINSLCFLYLNTPTQPWRFTT